MKKLWKELALLLLVTVSVLGLSFFWLIMGNGDSVMIAVETVAAPELVQRGGDAAEPADPVNLNTATLEELETLSGIGERRAEAILAYREEHGAFQSVEELTQVPGIGEQTVEQLRDEVQVD